MFEESTIEKGKLGFGFSPFEKVVSYIKMDQDPKYLSDDEDDGGAKGSQVNSRMHTEDNDFAHMHDAGGGVRLRMPTSQRKKSPPKPKLTKFDDPNFCSVTFKDLDFIKDHPAESNFPLVKGSIKHSQTQMRHFKNEADTIKHAKLTELIVAKVRQAKKEQISLQLTKKYPTIDFTKTENKNEQLAR